MRRRSYLFLICLCCSFFITSKVGLAVEPLPAEKYDQIGNLRDYNAFIDGEHSANSADTEGPIIITGNSLFPNDLLTFTFGSSFLDNNTTVGSPLFDTQVVNLLINGEVKNYSNAEIAFEESSDDRGWVIGNQGMDSWLTPDFIQEITFPYSLDLIPMNETLLGFRAERDRLVSYIENAVSDTTPTEWQTINVWGTSGQIPSIPINRSAYDSKILVIDLDNVTEFQRGPDSINIKGLGLTESLMAEASFDSLVVKSSKEKIVFSGGIFLEDGEISMSNPLASIYAKKISFHFPNATQITNYSDDKLAATPPTLPAPIDGKNTGVDLLGEDLYQNISDKSYATATIGSILAPQATVVYSGGNINGLILVKDFHQRDGAGLHNFRANWLEPDFELTPKGSIQLVKQTRGQDGQLEKLPDAKFIVYREVEGTKEYFSFIDSIGFVWLEAREEAYQFITNSNGTIFVSGLDVGTYYMEEIEAPAGHELLTEPTSFTITETDLLTGKPVTQQVINVKTPLIDIKGEKIWRDNGNAYNTRPDSVVIELYRNNEKISEQTVSSASSWRYEFIDLDQFDDEGILYIYTVREVPVLGYETVVSRNGQKVLNTLQEKMSITGNKIWLDNNDFSGLRPATIKVELFQNSVLYPIVEQEVSAATNWTYTFNDLEKYDQSGRLINYRVVETPVAGYESNNEPGTYNIKNVIKDTIRLQGQKTWDDKNDSQGIRPETIVIELLQNNVLLTSKNVTAATNWQYEFLDLPKYDAMGVIYDYKIREPSIPGYRTIYDENNVDVTNRLELIPEKPISPIEGDLRINYVSDFDFGELKTSGKLAIAYAKLDSVANPVTETYHPAPNFVSIQDDRGTKEGWRLTVSQTNQLATLVGSETIELDGAEITLKNAQNLSNSSSQPIINSGDISLSIDGATQDIATAIAGSGMSVWSILFGEDELQGSESIQLTVPGETKKMKNVEYKTTLNWNLADTPN